mgnify:CR=1 FL=1
MSTMTSSPNPFHFGKAVSGADFCPRPKLEAALREKLRAVQNTLVQGDRRMGKTSLIRRASQNLPGYHEIYVDLFGVRTIDAVVKRFATAIAEANQTTKWGTVVGKALSFVSVAFSKGGFTLTFNPARPITLGSLHEVFALLKGERNGKWVVILDEFQEILKFSEEQERLAVIAQLRSSLQFLTATPVIFAGSSRNLMHGIFNHPQSAFFKAAVTLDVGPLERDAFSDWICEKFTAGSRRVNRETLERIFQLASDVPGDVQQFCSAIWEVTPPGQTFGEDSIPRALERIWEEEQRSNEDIVSKLTALQQRSLVMLAANPDLTPTAGEFVAKVGAGAQGGSIFKAFERLAEQGVLMKKGTKYHFVNPYFREWVKHRFAVDAA